MKTFTFVKSWTVKAETEEEAVEQFERDREVADSSTKWELVDEQEDE